MHRVLAAGPLTAGARVALSSDESHHLQVRRAASGEPVELLDGRGTVGRGTLAAEGRSWAAEIEEVITVPEPPALVLLVGAGDRDRFGWLVEKAVELGVTHLVPVEVERSRHVATRLRASHRDKLERRAAEALKQCGGAWAPRVADPTPLADALRAVTTAARWLTDAAGDLPGRLDAGTPITIAIGPEGGFTEAERAELVRYGFTPVRLGPRVLRFETAALAAAALVGSQRKERH